MKFSHLSNVTKNIPCQLLVIGMSMMTLFTSASHAAPLLKCSVSYAGSTQIIETSITSKPYDVASVDIGERFRFKAIMVGVGNQIDYIKLYAYFQTRQNDIPIHQATYLPPFTSSNAPLKLTPFNHLYAGEVERELQYQCTLQGTA
ncbi:MAG: hypothetical protein Q7T62_08740 [Undibacterium sp.]|jgi:hypothetical protein|nr:hypothetical protein [Undibacterium sp.]